MDNTKQFQSISQRVLFAYQVAFSDFVPVQSDMVSDEGQRVLHNRMRLIQERLYDNPKLLGLPEDMDQAYPWELCNNRRPEWNQIYLSVYKSLYQFYHFLYVLATEGEVDGHTLTLDKAHAKEKKAVCKSIYRDVLKEIGFVLGSNKEKVWLESPEYPEAVDAIVLLGQENRRYSNMYDNYPPANAYFNLFCFAACSYQGNSEYLLKHIDELYGLDGLWSKLRIKCENRGYTYGERVALSPTDFIIQIEISNGVGGFLVVYNPRKEQKVAFGTMNGIGEKAILEHFEELECEMQDYFMKICRPCSGCMGCTKSGKNKMFTVAVSFHGEKHNLCPMFPEHLWDTITQERIEQLMRYHELQLSYSK